MLCNSVAIFRGKKPHLLRKFPFRVNKDKGRFTSGMIKGSYLSPLALQSTLECSLHIKHTEQGEGVALPHHFSSWETSRLSAATRVTPGSLGQGVGCGGSAGKEHGNYHSPRLLR